MNTLETLLNIIYLFLAHVSLSPVAPLIGFTAASLTLAKTILYWSQEYFCGYCAVGHNTAKDLFMFWILPNGCVDGFPLVRHAGADDEPRLWIIVPGAIALTLGRDLARSLRATEAAKASKKRR
jgi:hypothetical protein